MTALTLLTVGVPLAIVVSRYYENAATVTLQRRAADALADIAQPADRLPSDDADGKTDTPEFGVYDGTGTLVAGKGPELADQATRLAFTGGPSLAHEAGMLVYAVPRVQRNPASIVAVVRVEEAQSNITGRVHRAWQIMALAGLAALALAWIVATALARRLARPIAELAASAERIGAGGVLLAYNRTGVSELDVLGETLTSSSVRLAELLARERTFTSDVSHQLRTPLAGLRLRIESVVDRGPVRSELLTELDRLQATVEHLLALNRDSLRAGSTQSLADLVSAAAVRWRSRLDAFGRRLQVSLDEGLGSVKGSSIALAQILDVLIDNAMTHGEGTVALVVRSIAGGAAIDVTDEGDGVDASEAEKIFERHHGRGNGIGLALARSLTEAEGGRLIMTQFRPIRFSILLANSVDDIEPLGTGASNTAFV